MKKAKLTLLVILIFAILLPIVSLVVPGPTEDTALLKAENFAAGLAACVFFATLYMGASALFMIGLDVFKDRLKRAYSAICTGLILLGIATVQIPILIALNLLESPWSLGGGLLAPFIMGGFMLYLGLRSFATALGDKSPWTSAGGVLVVALVFGGIFAWLARDWSQISFSSISFAGNIVSVWISTAALALAIRIHNLAGPAYTQALSWFIVAMVANLFGQFPAPILEVAGTPESPLLAVPQIITGLLFVKAGYAFNKIKDYQVAWFASLFGSNVASGSSGASAIDAVTYLASLASNPREIDTILDDLRQVTAQMTANRPLSDQEQAKLAVVYSKLIDYLVQKESLRKFTREGLSAKVHAHFKQDAASAVFWQKITT